MSTPAADGFVYALGDSHVRTYSYHDRFLPLYIGPGFANCFLTADLAAATEAKIRLNLARLPGECALLLSLGEPDVRFHAEDRFGTRAQGDGDALRTAVARYAATLERIGASTRVRLAVVAVPPSVDARRASLARLYNALLAERCAALRVPFVDIGPGLVAQNGLLQSAFDADGIHLTPAILPVLSRALRAIGFVPAAFPDGPNFAWSFNYRIALTANVETRFWGNKPNATHADDLVARLLRSQPAPESAAVLNCREGYVALALAARGAKRIVATDPDPAKRRLAEEVVRFAQCAHLSVMAPDAFEAETHGSRFGLVIDYNPERAAEPDSEHLARVAALGRRGVMVAQRAVLDRHPGLANGWRVDETVFGEGADEIIMDTQHN